MLETLDQINWSALNDGLTNTNVYPLAISPHPPIRLYAGTDSGVFVLQASPPATTFAVNSTADAHAPHPMTTSAQRPTVRVRYAPRSRARAVAIRLRCLPARTR